MTTIFAVGEYGDNRQTSAPYVPGCISRSRMLKILEFVTCRDTANSTTANIFQLVIRKGIGGAMATLISNNDHCRNTATQRLI